MSTRKKKPPPPEIGLYDLPTAPPPTTPQRPSPPPPTPREEAKEPPAPPPAETREETPKEKLSRKERKKREDAAKKAAAAALAKTATREAREARERRYRREIDDARRSLVEQQEMWLGLVKDSEPQCRDLELEVAEVRREEAALSAQLEDVRRNDDGAVEVLTGELVAMKLRAAELSNECDMLDHHATLVAAAGAASMRSFVPVVLPYKFFRRSLIVHRSGRVVRRAKLLRWAETRRRSWAASLG